MKSQTAQTTQSTRIGLRGSRLLTGSAVAGVAYVVAWVAGLAVWPSNLDVEASNAEVVASYSAHQAAAVTQYLLVEGVAGVALALVVLALGRAARRRGVDRLGRVALIAGLGAATLSLIQCALGLLLAGSAAPDGDASRAGSLFDLSNRLDGVKMFALAALAVAGSGLARRGLLPRWLGYTGAALAVALVASGTGYVLLNTTLARAAFASLPLLLVWVLGTGVALARLPDLQAPEKRAATNGSPAVEARELTRRYGEGDTAVEALRGISLAIERGKLTAIMGPSGSGKSTLMHILAGLDQPTSGDVTIEGISIAELDDNELTKLRREHIGFVFQSFNLLPMLTVEENVLLPLLISGEKPDRAWFDALLRRTGLAQRRRHRPSELSGGQQQRVAIARALVTRPTVVFADEPTGNLDSATSAEILDLLRESADTYGQTTVIVTHDPQVASIADRILFIADGRVVKDLGSTAPRDVIAAIEELAA